MLTFRRILPKLLLVLVFATTLWAYPWLPNTGNAHQAKARSTEDETLTTIKSAAAGLTRNCTPDHFPRIFDESQLERGAVLVHVFATLYIAGCISYICHVYFVPSVERICTEWNISEDVAGATIMAVGTSLPELFLSIMGTFVTEDDTGIGTIIGASAVNLYSILVICAFLAPKDGVKIHWFPVLYNGFYWIICMIVLIAVVIDGKLLWWESLIFAILYIVYVSLMIFNTSISKCIQGHIQRTFKFLQDEDDGQNIESVAIETHGTYLNDGKPQKGNEIEYLNRPTIPQYGINEATTECTDDTSEGSSNQQLLDGDSKSGWCSVLHPPESRAMLVLWLIGLPIIVALSLTVPDCRKPGIRRRLYLVTFIMVTMWCALFCYLLFWSVSIIGEVLGIPRIVMGFTILAFLGGSLPNIVSCAILTNHGHTEMAVASISGSNTFTILVGLGIIWLTKTIAQRGAPIYIDAQDFAITSTVLLAGFVINVIALSYNNWILNKRIGVLFIVLYLFFLVIAISVSYIGNPRLTCKTGL